MTPAAAEGLAAAVNFNFNLLQVLVFINIVVKWLRVSPETPAVRLFLAVTEPVFALFYRFFGSKGYKAAPYIALAVLIPLQMLVVAGIRG